MITKILFFAWFLLILYFSLVPANPEDPSPIVSLFFTPSGFAILIHGTMDFNLHIPANIVCFVIIAALVFGMETGPEIRHKGGHHGNDRVRPGA